MLNQSPQAVLMEKIMGEHVTESQCAPLGRLQNRSSRFQAKFEVTMESYTLYVLEPHMFLGPVCSICSSFHRALPQTLSPSWSLQQSQEKAKVNAQHAIMKEESLNQQTAVQRAFPVISHSFTVHCPTACPVLC